MARVLIVGATRGLGASLTSQYASKSSTVFATTRGDNPPKEESDAPTNSDKISWITGVDVSKESAGSIIASKIGKNSLDIVIISAGYFATESFDKPDFEAQIKMYTTSSIAPVFIVHHLYKAGALKNGSKVILVSSESGSITLRHAKEGGGNYGHHASKAASNMAGKLLSLDLEDKGVAVGIVHPGFMRTDLTKGVGFDKYYDDGGAVTPEVAATSLIDFIDGFDMKMTGQYWAPRGSRDIGTAEPVLGKGLPTPLQLPW